MQTDQEGRFTFAEDSLPANPVLCLLASSYLPRWQNVGSDSPIVIALERGRCVNGKVLDEFDAPVANALVRARGMFGEDIGSGLDVLFGPGATPEYAETLSAEDGSFRLCGLAEAGYRFSASLFGYYSESHSVAPVLEDANTPVIVLRLVHLYVLDAVAVDNATSAVLPFATYNLMLPEGGTWLPAADSAEQYLPSFIAARSVLTETGARAVMRMARPGKPVVPVRVVASAPGYTRRMVEVPLHPAGERHEPVKIAMGRQGADLVPITLRAVWKSGKGFSGTLILRMRRTGERFTQTPVVFRDGACESALALPLGRYEAQLQGHEASTAYWEQPTEEVIRVFEVPGAADDAVTFVLVGGALVLAPKTEAGLPIPEFTFTITGGGAATTQDTWRFPLPLARADADGIGGVTFYLGPGSVDAQIKKHGFLASRTTLALPDDGSVVRWDPVLITSPR